MELLLTLKKIAPTGIAQIKILRHQPEKRNCDYLEDERSTLVPCPPFSRLLRFDCLGDLAMAAISSSELIEPMLASPSRSSAIVDIDDAGPMN